MNNIQLPSPPRGWKANLWRAPIWFYRMGLGGLLGKRFLLLNHVGRKSGQSRQAVIEVVKIDAQTDTYYSVSGFGEKAHWFQNIMHTPDVDIQVGGRKMSAHAERLSMGDGEAILADYAYHHPTALRELSKILNIPYDGSPESVHAMARALPVVAFHVL
ncbi:MAG: nitroreductase family deazaflavin-dependent oxidoreductase [Chloroflexota bacterium]